MVNLRSLRLVFIVLLVGRAWAMKLQYDQDMATIYRVGAAHLREDDQHEIAQLAHYHADRLDPPSKRKPATFPNWAQSLTPAQHLQWMAHIVKSAEPSLNDLLAPVAERHVIVSRLQSHRLLDEQKKRHGYGS